MTLTAVEGWRVSPHARERANELGFDLQELVRTAADPEQSYTADPEQSPGDRRRVCQRGDIAVIVSDLRRTIVTVLLRQASDWTHGTDRRHTSALPAPPSRRARVLAPARRTSFVQLNLRDALAMVRQGYSIEQAARLSGYDAELLRGVLGVEEAAQ